MLDCGTNSHDEVAYLRRFNNTRRMRRTLGPYYTGTGSFGQDREADILFRNTRWEEWEDTKESVSAFLEKRPPVFRDCPSVNILVLPVAASRQKS